jgi:hypothetical protein
MQVLGIALRFGQSVPEFPETLWVGSLVGPIAPPRDSLSAARSRPSKHRFPGLALHREAAT